MVKTNVMRLLEVAKIEFLAHEYDPAIVDGVNVAAILNQDPQTVLKTLVCVNERKEHFIFDVPVSSELDMKKAAKVSQSKFVEMAPLKELLPLTGYVHGGCSPIGLKKPYPVFIEETSQLFDKIFVSAGKKGQQIEMSPFALQKYTHAVFADLISQ
jgi:Cys-tRNA(Pro)/Cys-tRNA(Cys) deacylase